MRYCLSFLFCLVLLLFATASYPQPGVAAIRQQEESSGQILYQSRHNLRDECGDPWQSILFKRIKEGQVTQVDLRLVGFPDTTAFAHPQSLAIATRQGEIFRAGDRFAEKSPAPNVGQFDLQGIVSQLPASDSIELILPLTGGSNRSLIIPPSVVLEWQAIALEKPSHSALRPS